MNKEDMREKFKQTDYSIDDCTCNNCPEKDSCKYAFDLYNTNDDCLASK